MLPMVLLTSESTARGREMVIPVFDAQNDGCARRVFFFFILIKVAGIIIDLNIIT